MRNPVEQSRANQSAIFILILLVVPSLLASCRGRQTLSDGDKKKVEGQVVTPSGDVTGGKTIEAKEAPVAGINTATVWFTKTEGDKLTFVSEPREHGADFANPVDGLTFAIRELLAGPKANLQSQGAASEIPPGTVLIGVTESKDSPSDLVIDMSRRFSQGAGPESFETRIEQIRRTASAVAPGRNIFLNVEGQRLTATGEGLEVRQPICGPARPSDASAESGITESAAGPASGATGDARNNTLQLAH